MEINLPYGHSSLKAHIPEDYEVDIIDVPYTPPAADPLGVVEDALENLFTASLYPCPRR